MRLISIVLGTLAFFFIGLGIVYFWGMGQVFPKYENAFFEPKTPWIAVPWSFKKYLNSHHDTIIWVDIYRAKNQTLLVEKNGSLLTDILKEFPNRRYVFNIISNVEDIDKQMTDFIRPLEKHDKILVQSEFDVVLRSMKYLDANIPYGASQSDRLRFRSFEDMAPWNGGLLPATPFKNDVYVSPLKWRNIDLVTKNLVQEIHRRQKWVLLGPLHTQAELDQAKSLGADGYYIDNMALLNSQLTSH